MNGIINVLKPPGMSSHQVVSFMRRLLNTKKVGHTGTLDPGASGVLPIVVGHGTKIASYLTEHEKTYVCELTLGISTKTQDLSGETIDLNTDFTITPHQLADVLASFQGPQKQIPPMASAVRVGGKRLYELERQGITIERKPRQVEIYSLSLEKIWSETEDFFGFGTRILLKVICSKGTYVRTLCHDIGEKLGSHGHLSFLTRTQSGPFSSKDAYTLEQLELLVKQGSLEFLLPLTNGLPSWPVVLVNPLVEQKLAHGNFILPEDLLSVTEELVLGDDVVLQSIDGEVLALATLKKTEQLILQPFRVFQGG